jgi:hypothetical protein
MRLRIVPLVSPFPSFRSLEPDGADSENSPFLKLALLEEIQAVNDGMEEATVPVDTERPEEADQ